MKKILNERKSFFRFRTAFVSLLFLTMFQYSTIAQNIAEGKTATSDSELSADYGPEKAVDGSTSGGYLLICQHKLSGYLLLKKQIHLI